MKFFIFKYNIILIIKIKNYIINIIKVYLFYFNSKNLLFIYHFFFKNIINNIYLLIFYFYIY